MKPIFSDLWSSSVTATEPLDWVESGASNLFVYFNDGLAGSRSSLSGCFLENRLFTSTTISSSESLDDDVPDDELDDDSDSAFPRMIDVPVFC